MNLQNAKIYKLTNDVSDLVYIGSTTSDLLKRFASHKASYIYWNKRKNPPNYTAHLLVNHISCVITLVENFPCKMRIELEKRERHWIENTLNCCNKNIPTRTRPEWYKANKMIERVTCNYCRISIGVDYVIAHQKTRKHFRNAILSCIESDDDSD